MSNPSETLTIGEVAARMGLRTSALRYYESVGVLPAPERESGQRRYAISILKQIEFIQTAQKLGFSIREMKFLITTSGTEMRYFERLQQLARIKLTEVEAQIIQAQQRKAVLEAGLICRCQKLQDCSLFAAVLDDKRGEV